MLIILKLLYCCCIITIDSIPPTNIHDCVPHAIDCAPNINAFIPDAQTLFTVVHGVDNGKPDNNAA
jgi:hypothetical protein